MVALYRDGRQHEALAVFRQLRSTLDEELGVEPGGAAQKLHQRILDHDPHLDWTSQGAVPAVRVGPRRSDLGAGGATASDAPRAVPHRRRPRPRRRAAVAAIVLVALALLTLAVLRLGPGGGVVPVPANVVALLSPSGLDGDVVPLPGTANALTEGAGALWALDEARNSLLRIDPESHRVTETVSDVGGSPPSLAVDGNDVWIAGYDEGVVTRVNTVTNTVVDKIHVGIQPSAVVASDGQVWVANSGDNTVQRIDPARGQARPPVAVGTGPSGLALDGATLWVANSRGASVTALDTASGERVEADVTVGAGPRGLAVTQTDVWVANELGQSVSRFSRETRRTMTIAVEDGPSSVVVLDGHAWVTNASSGSVSRIDVATNSVTRTFLGSAPRALAVAAGRVWVSTGAFASAEHIGGTLVYTTTGKDLGPTLDPASVYSPGGLTALRPVYDGLVAFRVATGLASQTLVPDLATFIPTPSDGGRTFVFTIRSGVHYSTGREVVASDFVLGFRRALLGHGNPDLFSSVVGVPQCLATPPPAGTCALSTGVSADDTTHRLTIRLSQADPDFLFKLALFVCPTPPGTPLTDGGMTSVVPGTGPYQITGVAPDRSFTLERNSHFHQWSSAAQPYGYPDRIRHQVVASSARGVADVLAGGSDVFRVGPSDFPSLAGHAQLVWRYVVPHTDWVYLNSHVAPFDDLRVRRAINYAVDRRALSSLYGATKTPREPSCQLLPPGFPAYRAYCPYQTGPSTGDYLGPDLERARQLVRASGTAAVPITVWAYNGGASHDPTGYEAFPPYLAGVLRSIGFRSVTVKDIPAEHLRFLDPAYGSYQIFTHQGWIADYPAPRTFYDKFSCGLSNISRYCNKAIEAVAQAADASAGSDPGRSLQLWTRVDRLLTDDAAFVTLGRPEKAILVSPKVRNVQLSWLSGAVLSQMWVI